MSDNFSAKDVRRASQLRTGRGDKRIPGRVLIRIPIPEAWRWFKRVVLRKKKEEAHADEE